MIMTLLYCLIAFGIGVIIGIIDCKHTFGIPRRATDADGEWLTHETLNEVYGYNRYRDTVSTEQ